MFEPTNTVAPNGKPSHRVFAQYYTWYGRPDGASGSWGKWRETANNSIFPIGSRSDPYLVPPAAVPVQARAYPLIGPYDSMNREVVAWHIRLAQAAGIEAFLVDWWGPATWQRPSGWTYDVFVKTVLPAAEQANFKVALFDEAAQFVHDFDLVRDWTIHALSQFSKSAAWLRVDGKPVWAVYQLWEGALSAAQGQRLIHDVEHAIGPVYWIFDRMRLRPASGGAELFTPDDWLSMPQIQCFMGYAMFSTDRVYKLQDVTRLYTSWVRRLHEAGKRAMPPVHPGHDNRAITMSPWVMPRQHGKTLHDFWTAALKAGADLIGVTSWNEWPETTCVEPALNWPDPYLYLRIIAEFQGRVFLVPSLPPENEIDPIVRPAIRRRGLGIRQDLG